LSATAFIIVLQIVIVILLCEPRERRQQTVRVLTGIFFLCVLIRYAAPAAMGFLVETFQPVVEKIGWPYFLFALAVLGYIIALFLAWRRDAKENKAIRSGSQVAFNKRVEDYVRDHKYSRERAIEVTTSIRDDK
jgi:preprotein translocase subunit YajC